MQRELTRAEFERLLESLPTDRERHLLLLGRALGQLDILYVTLQIGTEDPKRLVRTARGFIEGTTKCATDSAEYLGVKLP